MQVTPVTLIGLIAAVLTTSAFFPQAIKIWKNKSAKDISLPTFLVISTGFFVWLVYGVLIKDLPVIFANIVSFIVAGTILIFKIKYR